MNEQQVHFEGARGLRLAGVLHPAARTRAVIICHGMLSTKESPKHQALARALVARGVTALRFDFAGRGESEGALFDLSYSGELDDLSAALAFLGARGVERLALFGSSMGGAVALLGAVHAPRVVAVATMAAVGRPQDLGSRQPEAKRAWLEHGFLETEVGRIGRGYLDDLAGHDVLAAVGALEIPLLVYHGDGDEVVPVEEARAITSAARRARLEVMPGADHQFSDPGQRSAALADIVDFLVGELEREPGA